MTKRFFQGLNLLFLIFFINPNLSLATPTKYVFNQGKCSFLAKGNPGFLKIEGEGGQVKGHAILDGTNKVLSGEAHVALKDFETGIDTRDEHMQDKYLESKKYPEAVFKFENIIFKDGKIPEQVIANGTLSLHGVTKPVKATLKFEGKDKAILVNAAFVITLSDFAIAIPSFMSITVAQDVEVSVDLTAIPQPTT